MTTIKRIASNRLTHLVSILLLLSVALYWFYPWDQNFRVNPPLVQRPELEDAQAADEWYVSPTGLQTNSGAIDSPWNLAYALGGAGGSIQPGDTVWLRGGTYTDYFSSSLTGTDGNRIALRQYPGERAIIDGRLMIFNSSWADYWGFEITNPSYDSDTGNAHNSGLWIINSSHNRYINLVVHDVYHASAIGFWVLATESEMYGTLIYENGKADDNLDHGIYTQNNEGIKTIKNNIFLNNWAYGLHVYGGSGYTKNYQIEENIFINNGRGNQADALVGGATPSDNLNFINNKSYNTIGFNTSIQFGYAGDHLSMSARNNYLAVPGNKSTALRSQKFNQVEVTNNTLIGMGIASRSSNTEGMVSENWDNNTYYQFGTEKGFRGDGTGGIYFDQWKTETGYDANTTWINSLPTGTRLFVQPNEFEPTRSHITIYNWDNLDTTTLSSSDLSGTGISNNDSYEIRDVQNYFGDPIATGRYNGSSISVTLPDTGSPVYQPASGSAPAHTSKQFNAFVLTYTPATYHTITPTVSGQGSLSISSPTQVLGGDDLTVTTTPSSGWHLSALKVDGGTVEGSSYTFSNISSSHTIEAVFEIDQSQSNDNDNNSTNTDDNNNNSGSQIESGMTPPGTGVVSSSSSQSSSGSTAAASSATQTEAVAKKTIESVVPKTITKDLTEIVSTLPLPKALTNTASAVIDTLDPVIDTTARAIDKVIPNTTLPKPLAQALALLARAILWKLIFLVRIPLYLMS
ncbi:MAG: hypothetical protein AAB360_02840 [Patescibacteria group bacterium]